MIFSKKLKGINVLKKALDTIEETNKYEELLFEAFAKGKKPPQKFSDAEKEAMQRMIKKFDKMQDKARL